MEPNKKTGIAQRKITMLELLTMLVVVFVGYKYLIPNFLPSSRNSRKFYNFLAIYMCWNSMENSRVFTSQCAKIAQNFPELGQASTLGLVLALQPEIVGNWAIELGGPQQYGLYQSEQNENNCSDSSSSPQKIGEVNPFQVRLTMVPRTIIVSFRSLMMSF